MKSRKDFDSDKEYRDYLRTSFAMAAMNGLLAVPDKGSFDSTNEMIRRAARLSVVAADELLKALDS